MVWWTAINWPCTTWTQLVTCTRLYWNNVMFHWSLILLIKTYMLYKPFVCLTSHLNLIFFKSLPAGFLITVHLVCPFWSNSHIDPVKGKPTLTFKRTSSLDLAKQGHIITHILFSFDESIMMPYFNICKYLFKISLIWDGKCKQPQDILTAISDKRMKKQLMTKSANVIPLLFLNA